MAPRETFTMKLQWLKRKHSVKSLAGVGLKRKSGNWKTAPIKVTHVAAQRPDQPWGCHRVPWRCHGVLRGCRGVPAWAWACEVRKESSPVGAHPPSSPESSRPQDPLGAPHACPPGEALCVSPCSPRSQRDSASLSHGLKHVFPSLFPVWEAVSKEHLPNLRR